MPKVICKCGEEIQDEYIDIQYDWDGIEIKFTCSNCNKQYNFIPNTRTFTIKEAKELLINYINSLK